MAERSATQPSRLIRTICLPVSEEQYRQLVNEPARFREFLDACWADMPELFPEGFEAGYEMKDGRLSRKMQLRLRRIELRNGVAYTIRPSFVMPYLTSKVEDVETPYSCVVSEYPTGPWPRCSGGTPCTGIAKKSGSGDSSVAGTTVRRAELPRQLLADEHHERCQGEKVYVATTVAAGCCPGAEVADAADAPTLTEAYRVFRRDLGCGSAVRSADREHGRLEEHAGRVEGVVPDDLHRVVLLARVAEDPRCAQASGPAVR